MNQSPSKTPELYDVWQSEFAHFYILAKYGDYVWVRIVPRSGGLHPTMKTMSVHGFSEYKKLEITNDRVVTP